MPSTTFRNRPHERNDRAEPWALRHSFAVLATGGALSVAAFVIAFLFTDSRAFETKLESGIRAAAALAAPTAGLLGWSRLELSRREHHLGTDRDLTERYGRAIEQLGSEVELVRVGGVFAIERFALDAVSTGPRGSVDWQMAVHMLAALARRDSTRAGEEPPVTALEALQALGRFGSRSGLPQTAIPPFNLNRVVAPGAELAGAVLPNANLTDAKLSHANLSDAKLSDIWLQGAQLDGAIFVEAEANRADISWADLSQADLDNACLSDAFLRATRFKRARLLNTNLCDADLTEADLSGAALGGANLTRAKLIRAILVGANLANTDLTDADLTGADLTNSYLVGANLTNAKLTDAKVQEITSDASTVWPANYQPAGLPESQ